MNGRMSTQSPLLESHEGHHPFQQSHLQQSHLQQSHLQHQHHSFHKSSQKLRHIIFRNAQNTAQQAVKITQIAAHPPFSPSPSQHFMLFSGSQVSLKHPQSLNFSLLSFFSQHKPTIILL